MVMLSDENAEDFDEALKKINEILKKELSGFDYYAVYSLTKSTKDGATIDNLVSSSTSLKGASPFAVVKIHVGNIVSQVQNLLLEYQLVPTEPIIKTEPTGGKK